VLPVEITLSRVVGELVLETVPQGVTVRRADTQEPMGETPLRVSLPVGEFKLVLTLEGYVEQERSVTVRADSETRVQVKLEQAASKVSVLTVTGSPEGAVVLLGDRELGSVPLTLPGLAPGSFQLSVRAPGAVAFKRQVLLEPGAATRLDVFLAPSDSQARRWPRWVGYGVGLAAAVAGGAFGVSALSSRSTYFANPSRAGFDVVNTQNALADGLFFSGLGVAAVTLVCDLLFFPPPQTHGEVNVVR
jgi:hypothetical protein